QDDETLLLAKHHVLKAERAMARVRARVDMWEDVGNDQPGREPIPDEVKVFVWKRDAGKCVKCGSQEALEFDHIIPLAMGGSNTQRNLQLLCETCNKS